MTQCEFCIQYDKLPKICGDHRFADGTIDFCDFTDLGTGVSWINVGQIQLGIMPINFCPRCGRKLNA